MIGRWKDKEADAPETLPPEAVPVVWLLGKTGAGKSSLVRALTGQTDADVGDGFKPCTRTAQSYDFPPDAPLLRFLDTRGLGEAGYDPSEDLAVCLGRSHVVLVVCRLDDPVQGVVADALAFIAKKDRGLRAILVLTGGDLVPLPEDRRRAARRVQDTMGAAVKGDLPVAEVVLAPAADPDEAGLDKLRAHLLDALPAAGLLLERQKVSDQEGKAFQDARRRVLFYAGAAASSDIAPLIGAVSVPTLQLAMLRELGKRYGVAWDRATTAAFLGAMGAGVGARFAASFGVRQLAKFIPVYGQTVGAAASGSISFATTYALGRAAAYYLYWKSKGRGVDEQGLRDIYARAFRVSSDATD
ncbi:YcjF family protein [Sulfitobacter sp. S190]|uniref:YcjF family protein n=1 Tax=Sulfitobacter sp. S190 TaxID=2867022 RepID=UPI0021A8B849|nr:GTP-binding DUF697 domain-containing protein [Sulfitobacter sp. S190]UWR21747.1 GTP-binding DUF697 domain-containing protein [Sulfitobacter sp. S190]